MAPCEKLAKNVSSSEISGLKISCDFANMPTAETMLHRVMQLMELGSPLEVPVARWNEVTISPRKPGELYQLRLMKSLSRSNHHHKMTIGLRIKEGRKASEISKKQSMFPAKYKSRVYMTRKQYTAETVWRFITEANSTDEQDSAPVFLAYAQLYTFARMRLIKNPKALTLQKLHETLLDFQLFENRVADVIELARYAYSDGHIPNRDDDGTVDELRDLVVTYIATEFDIIGKTAGFVALLEEGGGFASDFCSTVLDGLL